MSKLKTWFFTEDCYPDLPDQKTYDSIRVDLPNMHCDPETASRLYNQYLELYLPRSWPHEKTSHMFGKYMIALSHQEEFFAI